MNLLIIALVDLDIVILRLFFITSKPTEMSI